MVEHHWPTNGVLVYRAPENIVANVLNGADRVAQRCTHEVKILVGVQIPRAVVQVADASVQSEVRRPAHQAPRAQSPVSGWDGIEQPSGEQDARPAVRIKVRRTLVRRAVWRESKRVGSGQDRAHAAAAHRR